MTEKAFSATPTHIMPKAATRPLMEPAPSRHTVAPPLQDEQAVPAAVAAAPPPEAVEPPSGLYVDVVKPAIDRTLAAGLLACAIPVLVAAALAVRLTMGRGVIYTQPRVGRDGRHFHIYKFRTMLDDRRSDHRSVPVDRRLTHKHPDDPRVTRVGKVLRKWSLDELPQLVNVLQGEMSLVGPRPELVSITESYEEWQKGRHVVRPGLTGLWQISERGGRLMHECVELDLEYIQRISWRTDLKILVLTPAAALGHRRGF